VKAVLAATWQQRDAAQRSRQQFATQVTVDEVQAALSNIDILVEKARFRYNK
jgi:hypothetical protein